MSTIEVLLTTFQVLLGIVVAAGVPWAIVLERRLAHIEAFMKEVIKGELLAIRTEVASNREHLRRHSDVVRVHDRRLMKIEQAVHIQDNSEG